MADRFLLAVQILSFLGALLMLLTIWFPPFSPEGGYTYTYPDGTVATPVAEPGDWSPGLGDVLAGLGSAIYLTALGAILFCLRRIGAHLREAAQ
ncbi:hypothetical protein [Jannaschia aquimarina]|nr:hypothetical protein [Jannaschia aquimarina]